MMRKPHYTPLSFRLVLHEFRLGESLSTAIAPLTKHAKIAILELMATTIGENATFLRVVVDNDFLKIIQDYRFSARHNSMSEAVRVLITRGLIADGHIKPAKGVPTEPPSPGLRPEIKDGRLVGWSANV
jgi:hypothetical protein